MTWFAQRAAAPRDFDLTDGFIRTRMPDAGEPEEVRLQNTSNHQIDMCPLYGRLPQQTDALRLRSENAGERGHLKSQLIEGEEFSPFLFDNGMLKEEFAVLDKPLGLDSILADTPNPEELRARHDRIHDVIERGVAAQRPQQRDHERA